MEIITTAHGWEFLLRWFHFLAGIAWIGMLYYFNLVQTPFFATRARRPGEERDDARPRAERDVVVPLGRDVHVPDRLDDRAAQAPHHDSTSVTPTSRAS